LHRQFVRSAARRPFRPCVIDTNEPQPRHLNRGKIYAGAVCLARWLRPKLGNEPMVGVWLPQSAGGVVTNLGLALLRKTSVDLNYTAGAENIASAVRQCGLRHVLTSRRFTERVRLDLGPDVELIYGEDARAAITTAERIRAYIAAILLPGVVLDWLLGLRSHR